MKINSDNINRNTQILPSLYFLHRTSTITTETMTVAKDTDLSVVAAIQCHPLVPEVLEEWRQDLVFNILRLNTIRCTALLDDLQNDLFHLLVWRLELTDQDQHHLTCIIVGVLGVHQRDQIANCLKTMPHHGQQLIKIILEHRQIWLLTL